MQCLKNAMTILQQVVITANTALLKKIVNAYFWETIRSDTKKWVAECPQCQRCDRIRTVAPVLRPIVVSQPWTVLGVDLIALLPHWG